MTSLVPPHDWTDIHWPDLSGAARWIAVLPLAATEQHGPHLPLGTDVMIAQAYLARVRELLSLAIPATFLPIQPVGISTEHIGYPGTLTLPTETALKSWMALGESVACAGIKKLVMVTSHGGNSAAMSMVAQDLRAQLGLLVVTTGWSRFGAPEGLFSADELRHGIHGGAVETSIMLARYPQALRWKRIIAGLPRTGQRRSRGRPRIFTAAALPAMRRRPPRKKACACSITVQRRSANCSPMSINSIPPRLAPARTADASPLTTYNH
jgi:creatinine amidohydrolase